MYPTRPVIHIWLDPTRVESSRVGVRIKTSSIGCMMPRTWKWPAFFPSNKKQERDNFECLPLFNVNNKTNKKKTSIIRIQIKMFQSKN